MPVYRQTTVQIVEQQSGNSTANTHCKNEAQHNHGEYKIVHYLLRIKFTTTS